MEQTRWLCQAWSRVLSSCCLILRKRFGRPLWTRWRTFIGMSARDYASICNESTMCRKPSKWNGQWKQILFSAFSLREFHGIFSNRHSIARERLLTLYQPVNVTHYNKFGLYDNRPEVTSDAKVYLIKLLIFLGPKIMLRLAEMWSNREWAR